MSQGTVYEFLWGPAKARSNAQKHDVTFDQAATVFLDALALTVYDEPNSHDEERWFTLGFDKTGKLLAVAHTYEITGRLMFGYALFQRVRRPDASDLLTKMNRDR
jgi:uncharacterized protein